MDCCTFKFVYLGHTGVGKTAIDKRFVHNIFDGSSNSTVGVSFSCKQIYLKKYNKRIKAHLWDTAGQERFKSILPSYYRGASAVLLIYDITQRNSFNEIKNYWIKEMVNQTDKVLKVYLIGNKTDLSHMRKVSYDEGKSLADEHEYDFYEISAKDQCLTEFLNDIAEQIYEKSLDIPSEKRIEYGIRDGVDIVNKYKTPRQNQINYTCC